ncbi:MAG TPA: alpha/beta hydrolase [Chitinophagaceae bacterium]|nr:alpha/beta hydrolase [Chitinophagaceae bacterium]
MPPKRTSRLRSYLRTLLWVLLVQLVLANISAALYAWKLTHLKEHPGAYRPPRNLVEKTWRIFTGPTLYRQPLTDTPSFPYSTHRLTTPEGLSIEAWYGRSDSSLGCVVFLHGNTASKSSLVKEAAVVRNWGYDVLLVDFRNHGGSGGEKGTFGMLETEEAGAALRFARQQGARKVVLYGVSLGAVVAIRAGSGGAPPDAIIADMPFGSLQEHLQARASHLGFPPQPFGFLVTFWIGVQNGYNGFGHRIPKYAGAVRCPVLLQYGGLDPLVSTDEIDAIHAALPGPATRVLYPQASHQLLLEADPLLWKKSVRAFLQAVR